MPTRQIKTLGITGASGTIGQALAERLADTHELKLMSRSLDGTDLMDLDGLIERFRGLDAVVHLAWQYADSGEPEAAGHFDNLLMTRHVLLAACNAGVGKVLLASSVHAAYFYDWRGPGLQNPHAEPRAAGPYGSAKVLVEEMGREFAGDELHVGCIRYGAVTDDDTPDPDNPWERRVWLSHGDLASLIRKALAADWPDPFTLCYAVSDNEGRVHDTANPFGWTPSDGATLLNT